MTMESDLLPPVYLSDVKLEDYVSDEMFYSVLLQAGWPRHLIEKAYEIAYLESSHAGPITRDFTGDASYGVFQIRPDIHTINFIEILGDDWADPNSENFILDPINNAKVALHIYKTETTANGKDKWFNWSSHVRTENLEGKGTHDKDWYTDPTRNTDDGDNSADSYNNTLINLNSTKQNSEGVRPRWKRLMETQREETANTIDSYRGNTGLQGFNFTGSEYKFRDKYPSQAMFDDYMKDNIKQEIPSDMKPPMIRDKLLSSKQAADIPVAGTDQIEDRFQPNFLEQNIVE